MGIFTEEIIEYDVDCACGKHSDSGLMDSQVYLPYFCPKCREVYCDNCVYGERTEEEAEEELSEAEEKFQQVILCDERFLLKLSEEFNCHSSIVVNRTEKNPLGAISRELAEALRREVTKRIGAKISELEGDGYAENCCECGTKLLVDAPLYDVI